MNSNCWYPEDSPQYLLCPPSLSWTARIRLLILSIRPLICPWSIPCHFLIRMRRNPSRVVSGLICLLTFFFMESHKCSIGFKSGLLAGQSRVSMPSVSKNSVVMAAVCGLALSCIRKNPSPTAAAYGTTTGRRTWSMYTWAVTPPLRMIRSVFPSALIPALQKSPSGGHSLAGRPHFHELGSDSTMYWPSMVLFQLDELQLASTYRLLSNQRIRPLSCLVRLSHRCFVISKHLSLSYRIRESGFKPILIYASHLWPFSFVIDN